MADPDPERLLGRTARQRRADAFTDICAVALANTDRAEQGGERPHVYLTVSWETLRRDLAAVSAAHPDEDTADAAETAPANDHTTEEASAAGGDTNPATAADSAGTSTSNRAGTSTSDGSEAPTSGGADPGRVEGNPADAEVSSAEVTGGDGDHHHAGPDASIGNGDTDAADGTNADSATADCAGTRGGWNGLTVLDWATEVGAAMDVDRLAEVLAGLHDRLRPGGPARLGPGGEPICAATARRLACDAGIIPVVLGSASEPLDIGRLARLVPAGLRRAVDLRDQHCRFPGCDRPARWCECHHVWFWRDGGPTKPDNLVLLCRFHHVRVHDYGWLLTFDPATG